MESSRLEEQLALIERRLSRIELNLALPPLNAPRSMPTPQAVSGSVRPSSPPIVQVEEKPGNWLGIIAVVCFVLAAGFIIKLSVDSGWLTPARQIGLAWLFGFGLIGAGLALLASDREYASLLPGTGVIVLYLAVFAAHSYYALIPFEVAIGGVTLVSALCIWLYTEIEHDVYPITAASGAYIAPALLGMHTDGIFSLYYFLLCSLAFATVSIWVQSRLLTVVAAYLAITMTAWIGLDLGENALVSTMLALHFAVFAVGTYLYSEQTGNVLSESEAWSFLPVLLIFYAMEYYFIDRIHPALAPWISLLFAAMLTGLYLAAKQWLSDRHMASQGLVLAFATIVCFHSVYLELLPTHVRPWLFVIIMLGTVFVPARPNSEAFKIPLMAVLAIVGIEYLTMVSHLLSDDGFSWILVSFAAFASLWLVLVTPGGGVVGRLECGHVLLGAAHLLAVTGLYRLTHESGSLAVSASWLLYALAVMAFAFVRQDHVMARSALFVLSFAAGKALLYDAASAPTIVRILCLLLTGAVLYGSGFLMRRISGWTR